jgi:hypothetical protein
VVGTYTAICVDDQQHRDCINAVTAMQSIRRADRYLLDGDAHIGQVVSFGHDWCATGTVL